MKKLITTVAVLGCAVAMVSAQTVTSANMVGYSKATISAGGLQILSAQFSGSDAGMTLDDAFAGLGYGAKVLTWTGSGYATYTYYGAYGWLDSSLQPAGSVVISSGGGVWVTDADAASGTTPITAGEVPDAVSVDVSVSVGLNMIANPYPVALALADIPAGITYEDIVYVWSGSGYTTYTYYGAYGWLDASLQPADSVQIGVGKAFWLSAQSAATLTFDKAF